MAISLNTNAVASSSTSVSSTPQSLALAPKPAPVPDLWYPDGNIILEAEGRHFRIFGGLLAARSSVFADMLAFPPPPADSAFDERDPTIDGCVVVHVYDSAADLAYFLRAVFDSSFFEPPPRPTTLPTVSAILRLALKYDVPFLTRRALQHLHTTFPTTLAGWRARDATRTIPGLDNTPFVVLRLVAECADAGMSVGVGAGGAGGGEGGDVGLLDWLVPSAAYCVCSHPFGKTLDGAVVDWAERDIGEALDEEDSDVSSPSSPTSTSSTSSEDDADSTADDTSSSSGGAPSEPVEPSMGSALYTGPARQKLVLSWTDQRALIVGRQRLLAMQSKAALRVLKCGAPELPPPPPVQVPAPPMGEVAAEAEGGVTPQPPVQDTTNANANVPVAGTGTVNGVVPPTAPPTPSNTTTATTTLATLAAYFPVAPTTLPNLPPTTLPNLPPSTTTTPSSSSSSPPSTYNLPLLLQTHCPTPTSCALARLRCADTLVQWDIAALLDYFSDNRDVYRTGFCAACWTGFEQAWEGEAGRMWARLPGVFGVGCGGEDDADVDEAQGEEDEEGEAVEEGIPRGWRALERERRRAMAV